MMNMRFTYLLLLILFQNLILKVAAQASDVNYDETKVGTYTLPNPLLLPSGKKVRSATEWTQQQRPRVLQLFAENVYGKMLGRTTDLFFKTRSIDSFALDGKAIRKQVRIYFSKQDTTASMDVLMYLPKKQPGKVPVFIGLNFAGNQTVSSDPGIFLSNRWIADDAAYKTVNHQATEASRGIQAQRWPVDTLIANGYGLATAYYGDLEPDYPEGWKTGIRSSLQTTLHIKPEEWSAIGAWAWGLS